MIQCPTRDIFENVLYIDQEKHDSMCMHCSMEIFLYLHVMFLFFFLELAVRFVFVFILEDYHFMMKNSNKIMFFVNIIPFGLRHVHIYPV